MALKKMNTEFVQLKKGDSVEGYLIGVGAQTFPPRPGQVREAVVPTLVLQRKNGDRFKVLLGSTVLEDAQLLKVHVWTVVKKAKESKASKGGNEFIEYDLLQDAELVLQGA